MNTFIMNESGQGLVEYGLLLALVALAAVVGVHMLSDGVFGLYERIQGDMPW